MKTINVHVKGMHCASCEIIIERKLLKVAGVHHANVDRACESATIKCDDAVTLDDLNKAISGHGYSFIEHTPNEQPAQPIAQVTPVVASTFASQKNRESMHPNKSQVQQSVVQNNPDDDGTDIDVFRINKKYIEIGASIIIIIGLYFLLSTLNLIPNLGVTDNMSYGFVFLVGLVASVSTCLAVSGGLLLALAAKYNAAHPNLVGWAKFRLHAYFNAGRIVSYTVLGAGIGIIGSMLAISSSATGIITIGASLLMVIVGLQLLQIFPALNKIHIKMPKWIAHRVYDANAQSGPNRTSAFLFGAATFVLPCGFTQALQLYVLAKGDPLIGALTMLAFSIGTAPSLLGIGAISSFSTGQLQKYFTTFAAVLVIILGVMNIPYGLSLAGIGQDGSGSSGGSAIVPPPSIPTNAQGVQVVQMSVRGLDYFPNKFTVKQGVPVEWVVDGTGARGCAQVLTSPKLGITERLSLAGKTTIRFTPTQTGFIPFHCPMGMTTRSAGFEVIAA